eukprot:ANDGO_02543.mRNA.1 Tubulin gamma chain
MVLTILIGQCGNQVGSRFWELINAERSSAMGEFYHADDFAKCVCIDTEPKVIAAADESFRKILRPKNVIWDASGRGNNWAMGFYGPKRSVHAWEPIRLGETKTVFLESAINVVRQEWERLDYNRSALVFHSLSGGTGSGFGSRLLVELRDEFPDDFLMTASVAPFSSGEIPLQNYNAALTVDVLQDVADAVFLFSNDELMRLLSKDLKTERLPVSFKGSYVRLSMEDVNTHIAASLAGLLFPLTSAAGTTSSFAAWDLISTLCPDRSRKFLHTTTAPFLRSKEKLHSFDYLSRQLINLSPKFDGCNRPIQSLATSVVVRGDSNSRFFIDYQPKCETILREAYKPVSPFFNPHPFDWKISRAPAFKSLDVPASVTVCSNRSSIVWWMMDVACRARKTFDSKAYLHWYQQYGLEPRAFEDAFERIQNAAVNYMM